MEEMTWEVLLSPLRRKKHSRSNDLIPGLAEGNAASYSGARTQFESDHDRILFCTPFRRLIDKTQVFPLEKKYDTIRRRLTHSYEVANICRSLTTDLTYNNPELFCETTIPTRNIPAVTAAAGLAHDLGNPPFGHEGESAIRHWFSRQMRENNPADGENYIFYGFEDHEKSAQMKADFLKFEGNAQTFRLVTRLQLLNDDFGLNLTFGTLSAMLKYVSPSHMLSKDNLATKKCGYFTSESEVAEEVQTFSGTGPNRNPLTYLMEAADDLSYSILDAEDAVKKGIVSYSDLVAFLKAENSTNDPLVNALVEKAERHHGNYRQEDLTPYELNDISMQSLRVAAFQLMVPEIRLSFVENLPAIMKREFKADLVGESKAATLCELLKKFDACHVYKAKEVLGLELQGYETIIGLMDIFWPAILEVSKTGEKLASPFNRYVYSRLSENYKRVYQRALETSELPARYHQLQLMTDMVAGMTDSYAVSTLEDLRARSDKS